MGRRIHFGRSDYTKSIATIKRGESFAETARSGEQVNYRNRHTWPSAVARCTLKTSSVARQGENVADIVSTAVRSRMMSGIRGRDTKPELAVRHFLHRVGFRYRLHVKNLPGKPDLAFPKFRVAMFVHGCFWHRHPGCRFATTPENNRDFWISKLTANAKRDLINIEHLKAIGWRVIVIWECGLKPGDVAHQLQWLPGAIRQSVDNLIEWPLAE